LLALVGTGGRSIRRRLGVYTRYDKDEDRGGWRRMRESCGLMKGKRRKDVSSPKSKLRRNSLSQPAVGRSFRTFPNPANARFHSLSTHSRQALRRPEQHMFKSLNLQVQDGKRSTQCLCLSSMGRNYVHMCFTVSSVSPPEDRHNKTRVLESRKCINHIQCAGGLTPTYL
jgi:hypothetical protein